ncbi:DoxX family protein [Pedobacter sp. SYSU D00535]|uniref:DoxX family protein n=1 Tax=Pedobacter sp. SYSU D00535 TaxID=2810308 RepID=UPI001F60C4C2|nr:DoxX family protein [Pedobacter sp. SYSU D00535]
MSKLTSFTTEVFEETKSAEVNETTEASRPYRPIMPDGNAVEKLVFKFAFLYFFIQAVPLDWKFYKTLFSINWLELHYGDIFNLTRYYPQFIEGQSYLNWLIVAAIAAIGAGIWSFLDKKSRDYNTLYYYLRVIARYRLALGVIGYGFLKFYPLQSPLPSISNLNTNYGDLTHWKVFSMSLGIVPNYESFLGLIEIFAGLLLLYRGTATFGAFIVLLFHGNVFMSNLAYEGGEHVYSLYLISFALLLGFYDLKRLYFLSVEQTVLPDKFKPVFKGNLKQGRLLLKSAFIFFFVFLYGYKSYAGYHTDPYQYPKTAGLADAAGIYNVTEFRINNKVLPYSATDTIRWKDVVFEKWATLSIRSNRPVQLEHSLTEEIHKDEKLRNYELAGAAGRHYYGYQIDEAKQQLVLHNRNKNYATETLTLNFSRPNNSRIILTGTDQQNNSIHVILDKINKKYLLEEAAKSGRRKGIKL